MSHSLRRVVVFHEDPQILSEWTTIAPLFGITSRLCRTVEDALIALSSEKVAALVTMDCVGESTCIPIIRAARAYTPAADVMILARDPKGMQSMLNELSISAKVLSQSVGPSDLAAHLIMSNGGFDED